MSSSSRFQASTSPALQDKLERVRDALGLPPNDKAGLLDELATISHWVIVQAAQGREVKAIDASGDSVPLVHPSLSRRLPHVTVTREQAVRLGQIMDRPPRLTPALVRTLENLEAPDRQPPALDWSEK